MIQPSRRAFLLAAAALPILRSPRTPIICSLAESQRAYRETAPFGGTLVESGVGFAEDNLSWLRLWGVTLADPERVKGPNWVTFDWPIPAMIRDFGRFCPVHGGTVIARLGAIPVAVRQGPLIVLGTPLGPHLYAGDPDAQALFRSLTHPNPPLSSPKAP